MLAAERQEVSPPLPVFALFPRVPVGAHDAGIGDFNDDVPIQLQKLVPIRHCVAHIETDPDVGVLQNRAVFNHGSVIHAAVFLNVAQPCDQSVFHDLGAAADIGWRYNPCTAVHFRPVIDPDSALHFPPGRPRRAAPSVNQMQTGANPWDR